MNQCHCDGIALHHLRSTTASPGSQVLIKSFPLNCVLSGEEVFSNKKFVSNPVLIPGAIDNNFLKNGLTFCEKRCKILQQNIDFSVFGERELQDSSLVEWKSEAQVETSAVKTLSFKGSCLM